MKTLVAIFSATAIALSLGTGCRCQTSAFSGGPAPPMAKAGPESWDVEGVKYQVAATHYLALPEGLQYTIEYEVPDAKVLEGMTDAKGHDMAFPLMRYAYDHRSYERAKIEQLGGGTRQVSRIGVSLFTQSGIHTQGYRVASSLEEIRAQIKSGR